MAQIPPIDDAYINEIIKSNGPYNPALLKTQGVKMRELIKLLRDCMEQGDIEAVKTTGDQNISGTKTFTLIKAEGISVNNLTNPALNTVISPVNGVETKLLNLNEGLFAVQLAASGLSALRSQTLQDKSGVVALTSDVYNDRFKPIAGTGISLNGIYPDITINTTGIDSTPDATTLIRGKVRLSGDLAGNADAPTVPELLNKISLSQKGIANGVATLDVNGKIPNSQIPALALSDIFVVASEVAMLALSGADQGDVAVRTDVRRSFILAASPASILSNWQELLTPTDAVSSVDGQVGNVNLTTSYIANSTALQISSFNISGTGKISILNLSAAPVDRSETTAQILVRNSATGTIEKLVADNDAFVRANGTTANFESSVRSTLLSGLSVGTNAPITGSNTIVNGMANLQAQVSDKQNIITTTGYPYYNGSTLAAINGDLNDMLLGNGTFTSINSRIRVVPLGTVTPDNTTIETGDAISVFANRTQGQLNNRPTLDGTGATGTWPIDVTGNAATATVANNSTHLEGLESELMTPKVTAPLVLMGIDPDDGKISSYSLVASKSYLGIDDGSTLTNNISGNASSVPWTGVSSRPTALSQFTNDLTGLVDLAHMQTISGAKTFSKPLSIDGAAGSGDRALLLKTSGVIRWRAEASVNPESGFNTGSNFVINRYSDAGIYLGNPFIIERNTGDIKLYGNTSSYGTLSVNSPIIQSELPTQSYHVTNRAYVDAGRSKLLKFATGPVNAVMSTAVDLFYQSIPYNTLKTNGDRLKFKLSGKNALNANYKYLDITVGGCATLGIYPHTNSGGNWIVEGEVMRVTATSYTITYIKTVGFSFVAPGNDYGATTAFNWGTDNSYFNLRSSSQTVANDDLIFEIGTLEYVPVN